MEVILIINYQLELENIISMSEAKGKRCSLLLHCCCGPCSTYVLEYLSSFFDITCFFYNPNIYPVSEYNKRLQAQKQFLKSFNFSSQVNLIEGKYDDYNFYSCVEGLENEPEGGIRCEKCFYLRMFETAKLAKNKGYDFFGTTLTISPHKDVITINNIGKDLEEKLDVKYLPSNFRKKGGYLRSIELCKQENLYRQNYCGCKFSL